MEKQKVSEVAGRKFVDPIVWIDLEMTGLDPDKDHIVEVGVVLTDGSLKQQVVGPNLVIHQSEEVLAKMGPWCQATFTANGLLQAIQESQTNLEQAEQAILSFLKEQLGVSGLAPLAGNSCYCDRMFLRQEMPLVNNYLDYHNLDVSSIGLCCLRWCPEVLSKVQKAGKHRALPDILESVEELRVYKQNLFHL